MLDRLEWTPIPAAMAREVMAGLVGAADPDDLTPLDVHGRAATLPFYAHWRLIVISSGRPDAEPGAGQAEDLYALFREGRDPLLLDGQGAPIHGANADESLHLTEETAGDYLRFFCFFLRANDRPFFVYEAPPEQAKDDKDANAVARPLAGKGTDAEGNFRFDGRVIFEGDAFSAEFKVAPTGEVEMVDDEPLGISLPESALPQAAVLGIGPGLRTLLASVLPKPPLAPGAARRRSRRAGTGPRPAAPPAAAPSAASQKTPIVLMVELLLDKALRAQTRNRLIGYFNAAQLKAKPIDQFAALMWSASPVVVVETIVPFVEETIADIVNDHLSGPRQLSTVGPNMPSDGVPLDFRLPPTGPALVLMPLQVYRSVGQVERISFEIATRDLAAIIACQHAAQLPESLRRIKDIQLRLPAPDPAVFEALFKAVMGTPLPGGWRAGGTDWVKHILPADFEHPRRMRLSRSKALEFIRAQVLERIAAVDAEGGLNLAQLNGLGEARQFAEDLIADIRAAQAGTLPWAQVDRGVLLVGAPGTGKTTLAKAIAKDCGIRFIQASAASWQAEGESLGPHIQAIRRTFSEARQYAPAILFIDEIDSLGNREKFSGNNAVYQTEVVNAVLEEMGGFDPAAPVFYIGATNHEAGVDPALRRSGRLDRVIQIPRPNSAGLAQIYDFYLNTLPSGTALDPALDTLAAGRLSLGLTGADVERIVRGAARRARKAQRAVSQADLVAEITNKPRSADAVPTLTAAEIERTANHEAGHALALYLSASKGTDIGYVTVVPRTDGTLGFVLPLPDERVHLTRRDYEDKLDAFLAGRAAEELVYGPEEVSSGACRDLESATELASRMVTQLGLGEGRRLRWSASQSYEDLEMVDRALAQSYARILEKLRGARGQHRALVAALVDREELSGDEVRSIIGRRLPGRGRRDRGAWA